MQKRFWVYIVASRRNGTIYTGHTDEIAARIHQHKTKSFKGFAARYGCERLVWCEPHEARELAFKRERQIKEWRRAWKLELIEAGNPQWLDLSATMQMWV